jgi:hypothetical protein
MSPKAIEERWHKVWQFNHRGMGQKRRGYYETPMQKDVGRVIRLKDK